MESMRLKLTSSLERSSATTTQQLAHTELLRKELQLNTVHKMLKDTTCLALMAEAQSTSARDLSTLLMECR